MSKQTELAQVADTITVNSGKIGIGTSSPLDALHVQGTIRGNVSDASNENLRLTTDGGGGFVVDVSDATVANPTWSIRTFSNEQLAFDIGGTERMRIDSNGVLRINGGSAWNETNQGTGKGSIHLDPNNATSDTGGAITFGASDVGSGETAMAGIYTRSDSAYGTKMYLATTDSYANGPKTAVKINNRGQVTTPRQPYFAVEMNGNNNYVNTAPNTALPFNVTVHNIGSHFNTSTYRFTAPITGKYLMAVGTINDQSNPIGRIMFYLNGIADGGNMKWGINGSSTAGGGSNTATSIIYMSAGDYVDVRSQSGWINNYQGNHSSWTGMLLG